jgi:hypothetical protein
MEGPHPLDRLMRFRPGDLPEGDPTEPHTPVEWEDNWLSNTLAWGSYKLLPGWCQTEEHWTSRVTQYLFTDCPCCLLFRGLSLGFIGGVFLVTMLTFVVWAFRAAA